MEMNASSQPPAHLSVLYHQIILALSPLSPGRYVDATLGAGGHAAGILEASNPDGQLLGLDLDPQALALASRRLSIYGSRATLVQASFTTLSEQTQKLAWKSVDGIVIDLGVSSMQLDTPERGFSFWPSAVCVCCRIGKQPPRSRPGAGDLAVRRRPAFSAHRPGNRPGPPAAYHARISRSGSPVLRGTERSHSPGDAHVPGIKNCRQ
jgi:hypothetical protein